MSESRVGVVAAWLVAAGSFAACQTDPALVSRVDELESRIHELESELHPRPPSPDGANSQTPVIKLITVLIFLLALVVLVYAAYSYFMERTETIEQASRADAPVLQPPEEVPPIEPQTAMTEPLPEVEEPAATPLEQVETPAEPEAEAPLAASEPQPLEQEPAAAEAAPVDLDEGDAAATAADEGVDATIEQIIPVPEPKPITGGDVMVVSADQDCWAEIVDANDIRMFYGMIQPGRDLRLTGQAPFDVFLGNAPAVTLSLNSVAIDMTKYIRSNNIAQFKLSVEDGRARFH